MMMRNQLNKKTERKCKEKIEFKVSAEIEMETWKQENMRKENENFKQAHKSMQYFV